MFTTMFAWAQSPASGFAEAGQGEFVAGLMTLGVGLGFVGWILFVAVREVIRIRREARLPRAVDPYSLPIDDLGPTMADGGEPIAPNGKSLGRNPLTRLRPSAGSGGQSDDSVPTAAGRIDAVPVPRGSDRAVLPSRALPQARSRQRHRDARSMLLDRCLEILRMGAAARHAARE